MKGQKIFPKPSQHPMPKATSTDQFSQANLAMPDEHRLFPQFLQIFVLTAGYLESVLEWRRLRQRSRVPAQLPNGTDESR
jgi:hypothetical protein